MKLTEITDLARHQQVAVAKGIKRQISKEEFANKIKNSTLSQDESDRLIDTVTSSGKSQLNSKDVAELCKIESCDLQELLDILGLSK